MQASGTFLALEYALMHRCICSRSRKSLSLMSVEKRFLAAEAGSHTSALSLPVKPGFFASRLAAARTRSAQAAYEALLEPCWDALWRYAYHTTGNADDAGDLLSETIIEGFRDFTQFRGETTFLRWMYRVMTTTRIDMARRARRHQAQSLDALYHGDEPGSFEMPDEASNPE